MAAIQTQDFFIRPAESMEEVHDLWWPLMQSLEWNRDENDAITHYAVSKNSGWLMVVPKETSKPEGCIVPFTFANGTGWVGYFLMNAAYRGRGWGRALFHALLANYVASGTTIVGLDGVDEQKRTYERRGFIATGLIRLMTRPSLKETHLEKVEIKLASGEKLVDLREIPHKALVESDLAHSGLTPGSLVRRGSIPPF